MFSTPSMFLKGVAEGPLFDLLTVSVSDPSGAFQTKTWDPSRIKDQNELKRFIDLRPSPES